MSSAAYGIPWRIDGPPPIPQAFGLVQAANSPAAGVRIVTDIDEADVERWLNGVEVYPYPITGSGVFNACAPSTSEGSTKEYGDENFDNPLYGAMTIYQAETCPARKVWSQEEFRARATMTLGAIESALVARELQAGDVMGLNPYFADGEGDLPNGTTATSPVNALSILENYIAGSKRLGLIHVSPGTITFLRAAYAIDDDDKDGVLRTANGIPVIGDFGYAEGAPPAGRPPAPDGQEWIYATGPIDLRRSEIFTVPGSVSEALDRGTPGSATNGRPNTITYRAERYYLADWDTAVQAAVLVDRCSTEC